MHLPASEDNTPLSDSQRGINIVQRLQTVLAELLLFHSFGHETIFNDTRLRPEKVLKLLGVSLGFQGNSKTSEHGAGQETELWNIVFRSSSLWEVRVLPFVFFLLENFLPFCC